MSFDAIGAEDGVIDTETQAENVNNIRAAHNYGSNVAAINQASSDVSTAGGGSVFVSREAGPYPLDSDVLQLRDNVLIYSDGARLSAGTKDVDGGDTLAVSNADTTAGNSDFGLRNLEIVGKVRIAASSGTCTDVLLDQVECYDVPDFAFDLQDLDRALVHRCYTSNAGAGTDNNGNDGLHLTDSTNVWIEGFDADSGDDVLALESVDGSTYHVVVNGVTGTSSVGDLIKLYTNPNSTDGQDIHDSVVTHARADGGVNAVCEVENDGAGEVYNILLSNFRTRNTTRGIFSNDTTNTHDITLRDCSIDRVDNRILQLGDGWESYGGRYTNAGMSASAFDAVSIAGTDAKLVGGTVGPATNHIVSANGARFSVRDVTIDAIQQTVDSTTLSPEQGVRINAANGFVGGNLTIDADQNFAIGSSGSDADTVVDVSGLTTPTNDIGTAQFSVQAMFTGADPPDRDLSTLSPSGQGVDGRVFVHDGNSAITANGGSTSAPGRYAWSQSDGEWKTVVAY